MSKIGCREIYFIETKQSHQINYLVDKVKEAIKGMSLPPEYNVRIYKNIYACCGIGSNSIIVEVVGPKEETIKAIDLKAMSKIIEFCEKEGYTTGHHSLERYEFV